jgi:hypothetical protein
MRYVKRNGVVWNQVPDLDCSRSGSFNIVLGARFRFDFGLRAIAMASFKPWQQR